MLLYHRPEPQPQTILVIDDAPEILRLFEVLLQSLGFAMIGAPTGAAGLAYLSRLNPPPAVVICDFRMPDMNGLTVLEQLRSQWPLLPFVLTSADCSQSLAQLAYEQGTDEFLPKPFMLADLRCLLIRLGLMADIRQTEGKNRPGSSLTEKELTESVFFPMQI